MKVRPLINTAEKFGFGILAPAKKVHIGDVSKLRLATNTVAPKAAAGLKREDVLVKFCERYNAQVIRVDRKVSMETAMEEYSRISKKLDTLEREQLLRLIDNDEIQLYERIHLFSRTADGKAALNVWLKGDEQMPLFKDLLKMERDGKISGKYIGDILRLTQKAENPEILKQFMTALENGQITNRNIKIAVKRCLDGEPLNFLRILPKVNKVSKTVSDRFLGKFDDIVHTFQNGRSIDELKKAGGIGLKYSRESLKANIMEQIEHLSPAEQEQILAKFGLKSEGLGKMSGLPVFKTETNGLSEAEKAINGEIGKFLNNNEIILPKGFESYKGALDEICEAFPEFRFTIGLTQNSGHEHKLAEHLLKVFQENTRNPLYKTLNETDRKVLGISSLLHDINKVERTRDLGHALPSSLSVDAILGRMNLNTAEKNRIINLVENHHWLERIPAGEVKDKFLVEDMADIFKSGNDFKLAKIFAESDLKAVNSTFFTDFGGKINSPATGAIEKEIVRIQKNGRMIYTADVTTEKALQAGAKRVKLGTGAEETENIVINARDLGLDENAFGYHSSSVENLQRAYEAGRHGVSGVFSLSIGKNGAIPTYNKDLPEFLVTRRLDMDNICYIRPRTSNTKFMKNYTFMSSKSRSDVHFAHGLKNKYKELTQKTISDEQYAALFREIPRDDLSKIHSNPKVIEILGGEKEAAAFEQAVRMQNEVYIPKETFSEAVAGDLEWGAIGTKRKNLSEIPFELRKFVQEKHLHFIKFD